jgi:hypothetical protein
MPSTGNIPGAHGGASWTDSKGNLWLFGSNGTDAIGKWGYLDDLWEMDSPLVRLTKNQKIPVLFLVTGKLRSVFVCKNLGSAAHWKHTCNSKSPCS